MSYQPINNQPPQYVQPQPGTYQPPQTYQAVPLPYGQPQPGVVYAQGFTQQQPMIVHTTIIDNGARKRNLVCGIACLLVILGISLAIYFGAVYCRGGKEVNGKCPSSEYVMSEQQYLSAPKEATHGSSCHAGPTQPGSCCDWRPSTCLTDSGCHNKYEYATFSKTGNCSTLLGLLSCAPAAPLAGNYMSRNFVINICSSFCQQLYQSCYLNDVTVPKGALTLTPREYCNNMYHINVYNGTGTGCYSGAFSSATSSPLLVSLIGLVAVLLRSIF